MTKYEKLIARMPKTAAYSWTANLMLFRLGISGVLYRASSRLEAKLLTKQLRDSGYAVDDSAVGERGDSCMT